VILLTTIVVDFIEEWGTIAGFSGIELGVFLYLFREIILLKIFPKLTKKHGFVVIFVSMMLIWSLSITVIIKDYLNSRSYQLTVFVTDKNGNVVLENEGRLNIPLGNRSLNEDIGVNGRTNFGDITSDNYGDSIEIGLQAEGWEIIGSRKFLFEGEPITLKLQRLESYRRIFGLVKNNNEGLSGVTVYIDNALTDTTDNLGRFEFLVPDEKVSDSYKLHFSKKGYKSVTRDYYPGSNLFVLSLNE
jgi:hypothetical protein